MTRADADVPSRVRSSIACLRCRRSKIKCDNTGQLDAACENCIKSGHRCEWPDPTVLPPKRTEPPSGTRQDKEPGHERKRPKRVTDVSLQDGQRYAEDILSSRFLDRDTWDQIFVTYKLHFATELPFLHIPTLKDKIYRSRKDPTTVSSEFNLVLLGLLALTARYHNDLVKYVDHLSQDKSTTAAATHVSNQDPALSSLQSRDNQHEVRTRGGRVRPEAAAASDFFADALDKALGSCRMAMTKATVERVQALLMLGLYQWISRDHQGLGSWMYVGMAIRMAQALKLGFGDGRTNRASPPLTEKILIDREVRRRTMFSCFILDRILSCGKDRVSCIRSEDLHVQLPCSEEDFDLTRQVHTGFLRGSKLVADAGPVDNPNVLGSFVQLIDIWGEISHYSNAGGRFFEEENVAPWDGRARFSCLLQKLGDFNNKLQRPGSFLGFTLSRTNYFKHDSRQGSSAYVSLHMLMSLSKIMLHREYIPFIPIKCTRPSGPLDEPTFAPSITPPGFWEASAKELFQAAADIADLIEICGDKLPHSSLVVFAIWHAAYVGVYARHFPQMDVGRSMAGIDDGHVNTTPDTAEAWTGGTKITLDALHRLARHSNLAAEYAMRFREADEFYTKIIADHHQNNSTDRLTGSHHIGPRSRSIRMGGSGGGVEEWHNRKDYLTNNGSIIGDDRRQNQDDSDQTQARSLDNTRTILGDPQAPGANTASNTSTRTQHSFQTIHSVLNGRPNHDPAQPLVDETRGDIADGGNQQASAHEQDFSHLASPTYGGMPSEHHTALDAELLADMEGKPFGFGYLDHGEFIGEFDDFSPSGWEVQSDEVTRLIFPLPSDDTAPS